MKKSKTNLDYAHNSKKVKNILIAILGISLLLGSCKKKEEPAGPKPDGMALSERFNDNRHAAVQEFTVDLSTTAVITGSQGTRVTFQPNSLGFNGTPVSGNITVELIEVYDKAGMLLQNMPTNGQMANGDVEMLQSAGEFYINAKQNGQNLEVLVPYHVESRGIAPADFEPMQVFEAGDNVEDDTIWEEVKDPEGNNQNAEEGEGEGADGEFVVFSVFDRSSFGWTNLDRWSSYTGDKTKLYVDVPDGFNGDNCEVYLSYDGEPSGLARLDIYNTASELFTEHYGRIPVGMDVHIILIAEIDGQLHYDIQAVTIQEDHTEVMADPQPTTQADLENIINALP